MRVIGLISGTSVDGIDAALVNLSGQQDDLQAELLSFATYPYPVDLRDRILAVCAGSPLSMAELAELDDAIATCFAEAAIAINQDHPPAQLIGSHGQTVFHRPPTPDRLGYSLQLGRGEVIAHKTGVPTVSNFRAADIAVGGQGAPVVPPVDAALLTHPTRDRAVQNLGGIGNVTYLPSVQSKVQHPNLKLQGWDTGPANVLIDLAVTQLSQGQQTYDRNGSWAAQGTPCQELVDRWLTQPFFCEPPPKSTGRELFGPEYFQQCWADAQLAHLSDADFLASLTELTAASIALNYRTFLPSVPQEVLLCGGGSRNTYLKARIQVHLPESQVMTTDDVGLNGDAKEAIAFAVLAYWHVLKLPGNLPEVTGAKYPVLLGEIHQVTEKICVIA
ncbi:anhydro-N-acetylmuramic acid kinase [Alkalinema sp. FACHB-956]|uniref:anhydro-N-acetylmuramic acid kinase n=1 Tax=Alkalinema sp. FACHB-956 TaxID=2692768 RepID=UPI001688DC9A|nr:anhydro-N-acetylmuramic acid kinase [Alkalinema sp. FACHB-956]MBD2328781.1 anhydro-N-acetylmuramic acid kinase [Alkalinema sp. FACHB-956]